MATVKGPLFSLDASGTVGKSIVFAKWKGRNYVRRHAIPANPKTAAQVSVRAMMRFLSQEWDGLVPATKADWQDRANITNISPFNAFCSYNMNRWGQFKGPTQLDPATDAASPGTWATVTATAGVRSITLSSAISIAGDDWGMQWFRFDTTGFTEGRNNHVRTIPAVGVATYTWLDVDVIVGTEYFYLCRQITDDGVADAVAAEVSATPLA